MSHAKGYPLAKALTTEIKLKDKKMQTNYGPLTRIIFLPTVRPQKLLAKTFSVPTNIKSTRHTKEARSAPHDPASNSRLAKPATQCS